MEFKITYQGKRTDSSGERPWEYFAWLVSINGETFSYRAGSGHATPRQKPRGMGHNKKPDNSIALETEWVHIPSQDDVLECLFSDADAGSDSFDAFCDNLGYSNDSLKALDTYRACMDTAKRLRKALGTEYHKQFERIQARNEGNVS